MAFQHVYGQQQAKKMLLTALNRDSLSHAYLFAGPRGTGKKAMALALAQAVMCLSRLEDGDACGHCVECRKVEHMNHPNVLWVEPDGASVKIAQIRQLQQDLAYQASRGQRKVYMIGQAERMTAEAANSLLKFLEEPFSPTLAVLLTDHVQALLPTILSRVQLVPFVPLAKEAMLEAMLAEGADPVLSRAAVHVTSGLEAARTIIQLNAFAEIRNLVIQLGQECLTHWASAQLTIHQKVLKPPVAEQLDLFLDLLTLWFKDMIQYQLGRKEQAVFPDQEAWLAKQAFLRGPDQWVACMEAAVDAKKRIRANVNPALALEQLAVRVQGG
ncbi:DNA polymerase III subunit delta' [Xylanibacillus composti]|uniref:DNA polymerase III subunit delta n=1 Tax=Xylanibacillus composti TaxID=1572762 RepID=A0A8J4GY08_9BACL|nr:DNA polymerase III subunit delta' [Xylanibacillus composti]MDT9725169.1 DNA polymerase III subunit delta' [Xylanibacillus composti]GIQ67258.1 DNA polymerase III subunit delta' [Xylanibacillus composti]